MSAPAPKQASRRRRRVVPSAIGALALVGGLAALQFGLAPQVTSTASAEPTAVRTDEATANRGSERSEVAPAEVTTTEAPTTTAAPVTTEAPTTTTSTAAPTTTTTAVPATTTTAPVAAAATSGNVETGKASYYDHKPGGCAHKTLPKGTVITVTNLSNGKSTTCVVNDRGPFVAGRIIDLETRVFKQVASTSAGVFTARISW